MEKITQKDGSIIFSIDTLSIVFENCTINDILSALKLDDKYIDGYEAILLNSFLTAKGYSTDLRFSMHGVGFQLRVSDIIQFYPDLNTVHQEDPYKFFNIVMPYVRIDAMGTALDNLRSLGINIEELVFNPLMLPKGAVYHFTRCDFAYDLFDHQPRFIDDLIDLCNRVGFYASNGLNVIRGHSRPIGVSIRTGDQKSVYLGKGASDRCLRVYDKLMEQSRAGNMNSEKFKFYNQLSYIPESWIRIELQVRRELHCHNLIDQSDGDPLRIFRYIFDHYAIREAKGREQPVSDVWLRLFDWEVIPSIIQNANTVEFYRDPIASAVSYVCTVAASSIITYVANFGWDSLRKQLNDMLEDWQTDPELFYKLQRLNRKMINPLNPPDFLYVNERGIQFI